MTAPTTEQMPRTAISGQNLGNNDYLPDLVVKISDLHINGEAVYGWRRGKRYLYIGISQNVFRRINTHNIIGKVESVLPDDTIDLWFVPKGMNAYEYERFLIMKFEPTYNVAEIAYGGHVEYNNRDRTKRDVICPMCKKVFRQKRYWQKWCSNDCASGRPKK